MATLLDSIFQAEQACDGYISITQVLTYLRCPESYRRKYVLREPEPPSVALIEGGAHHRALEQANRYHIDLGEPIDPDEHIELFGDTFTAAVQEAGNDLTWGEGETADIIIDRGRKLIQAYHATLAGRLDPKDVEVRIDAQVGAIPLLGYVDVIANLDGTGTL